MVRKISIITVLALVLGGAIWQTAMAASPHPRSSTIFGTVSVAQSQGKNVRILLQTPAHGTNSFVLPRTLRVALGNAGSMSAADIQPGDHLTVATGNRLRDTSQRQIRLSGIVSMAPGTSTGTVAVQTASNGDVAVDVSRHTPYSDSTHQTRGLEGLMEADQIRVTGIVDVQLGAMTRVETVTRLGPVDRRAQQAGGKHG